MIINLKTENQALIDIFKIPLIGGILLFLLAIHLY